MVVRAASESAMYWLVKLSRDPEERAKTLAVSGDSEKKDERS